MSFFCYESGRIILLKTNTFAFIFLSLLYLLLLLYNISLLYLFYFQYFPKKIHKSVSLKISISVETVAVVVEEFLAFFESDLLGLDSLGHPCFERAHHLLGIVFHPTEHILNGLAIDGLFDDIALAIDADMHCIDIAEEVMESAEDFLICAYEEDSEIIFLATFERVDRHGVDYLVFGDI